eukprot:TRINITY_DN5858_c0_g1_i1.p1 TRINITY_DN5858_c0_g1~~TRINITY_DN5858_c0_g1_i1.p1  ORF type:complete len:437 (+),score=219.18 TRINITY_DN5858_c0_g1_i1:210-1520(+)
MQIAGSSYFAVEPKRNCTHTGKIVFPTDQVAYFKHIPCSVCNDRTENWICLSCRQIFCSRYVNSHMSEHNQTTQHPIALSFTDLSVWCYECDSYIKHPDLSIWLNKIHQEKFGLPTPNSSSTITPTSSSTITPAAASSSSSTNSNTSNTSNISTSSNNNGNNNNKNGNGLEIIAQRIKNLEFFKIIFLIGAGVSVAAGIPDFRSPNSGLYDNLSKYNLPDPTAVFNINYFRSNPGPFYDLAKNLIPQNIKPTAAHYLIKLFQQKGLLKRIYTQNIDNLENEAGVPKDLVVEAHGTLSSAHCISCRKEYSIDKLKQQIKENVIPKCECSGVVKPDVVFFGEALPSRFFDLSSDDFYDCDLVIIIGTSLAVQPFASLVNEAPCHTPRLLINREQVSSIGLDDNFNQDFICLGDLQENCIELAKKLGWFEELNKLMNGE